MAQSDFPLCVYCDSFERWFVHYEDDEIIYYCGNCGNTVVVGVLDDKRLL